MSVSPTLAAIWPFFYKKHHKPLREYTLYWNISLSQFYILKILNTILKIWLILSKCKQSLKYQKRNIVSSVKLFCLIFIVTFITCCHLFRKCLLTLYLYGTDTLAFYYLVSSSLNIFIHVVWTIILFIFKICSLKLPILRWTSVSKWML